MESTLVFDYDPSNVMAQKVLSFIRSLGIFHERNLDLEEAVRDVKAGNVEGVVQKDMYGKSEAPFAAVNRKPILPEEEEIAANTRARSAKLRIAERI